MAGLAPFFVEMLEFADARPIPKGRLAEPFDTMQSAKTSGRREISGTVPGAIRLGFRIFDMTGKEVFRSRSGGDNVA
jgi:hypothetical protein